MGCARAEKIKCLLTLLLPHRKIYQESTCLNRGNVRNPVDAIEESQIDEEFKSQRLNGRSDS